MRTLFTYVGFAMATALLLLSMALLPAGPAQSAAQRPMALTASAEPPTSTPGLGTTVPPDRPTVQPTDTPTPAVTAQPTLTPPPGDSSGSGPGVADPYITKRGSLDRVQVGDFVEFTLTVSNRGSETATDVVITDALPDFLTLYNATTTRGLISVSGNTLTIEIGSVAPGEIITIVVLTQVNRPVAPPDNLNTATLSTSSASDDPSNNTASASLIATLAPTATPTSAPPAAPPTATPPAAVPPTSAPTSATTTTTAVAPVTLPPAGAASARQPLLLLSLLLLALGVALVSAVVRRRSLR